jgi:hypothetical protein
VAKTFGGNMGYDFNIRRRDAQPISFEAWQAAVESCDLTRLNDGDRTYVHPKTGAKLTIAGSLGDTEVFFRPKGISRLFGRNGEWEFVFHYFEGRVWFRPSFDIEDESHPVRKAAAELARSLSAEVVGDEGESYNW